MYRGQGAPRGKHTAREGFPRRHAGCERQAGRRSGGSPVETGSLQPTDVSPGHEVPGGIDGGLHPLHFFAREEADVLCAQLDPDLADAVRFLFFSTWRRDEVRYLEWRD